MVWSHLEGCDLVGGCPAASFGNLELILVGEDLFLSRRFLGSGLGTVVIKGFG